MKHAPKTGTTWKDAQGVEWRVVGASGSRTRSVRVGSWAEAMAFPHGIPEERRSGETVTHP